MKFSSTVFILIFLLPLNSMATLNAKDLYEKCTAIENIKKGEELKVGMGTTYCYGYIQGLVDGHRILSDVMDQLKNPIPKHLNFCLPKEGVENIVVAELFIKFYKNYDEIKNMTARVALNQVLRVVYPCN